MDRARGGHDRFIVVGTLALVIVENTSATLNGGVQSAFVDLDRAGSSRASVARCFVCVAVMRMRLECCLNLGAGSRDVCGVCFLRHAFAACPD